MNSDEPLAYGIDKARLRVGAAAGVLVIAAGFTLGSILHTNSSAADEQTSSVIDDTVSGDDGPITGDEANPTFGEADITDSTPVS